MNRTEQLLDRAMALIDSMEQRLRVKLRDDTMSMPGDRSVLLECDMLKSAVYKEIVMPKYERESSPKKTCHLQKP
jgi:hypothetical protein